MNTPITLTITVFIFQTSQLSVTNCSFLFFEAGYWNYMTITIKIFIPQELQLIRLWRGGGGINLNGNVYQRDYFPVLARPFLLDSFSP